MSDAPLIKLEQTFNKKFDRADAALRMLSPKLDNDARDSETQRLFNPVETVLSQIANSRATTIDGLVAKARAATKFAGAIDGKISESIIADLIAIGGAASV